MDQSTLNQVYLYIFWIIILLEVILSLYVLLLNAWHTANRTVSALFMLYAINNVAMVLTLNATEVSQIRWQTYVLASTSPLVQVMITLAVVVLLKPHWVEGAWRRVRWLFYALLPIPALLTVSDVALGTQFWYTGVSPSEYAGGYPYLGTYTLGIWADGVRVVYFYVISLLPILIALHTALRDDQATPLIKRLAWLLLGVQLVAMVIQMGLADLLPTPVRSLILVASLASVYAYATLQQMVSERRTQRGRLGVRLTAIILAIAAPIIVSAVLFSYLQTGEQAREESLERLHAVNRSLSSSVSVWRTLNVQSLQQLATLPDIVSMDARRQKPILEAMGAAHPHMYLISTTDMAGLNVARNDAAEPKDYSDRNWFLAARDGAPLTFQSLIGRTSGEPALVASMPIRDAGGEIVGVGMFASDLSVIAQEVQASQLGETGSAYVIDAVNLVIAHPDPAYSAELRDLGSYPPVAALREGRTGPLSFSDDNGVRWAAYVDTLDHGWGVIVQQQESELTSALRQTQTVTWIATAIGVVLLGFVASLAVRQALLPIGSLTETAGAITSGDLTRIAPVESEDEIGMLANAFNSMTTQLNEYIGTLEQRVAVRTRDLERRARYLEASAAVAREAASVLEPQELLDRVTTLISDHFGFYHAGIFLLDETGEWAVLQAASSEGGRRMLARSHRLPVGEVGIVGYVTGQGEPRVVLDVDQDTIYFDNPDMPDTRSEMALPLQVRGQIIGALDVQSREARAFTDEDVEVLQALADQVAIAISNAQLLQQAQASLDAERRAYGEVTRDAWLEMIRARSAAGYRSDEMGVTAVDAGSAERHDGEVPELAIPIQVRGQIIGTVKARKPDEQSEWNPDDLALMETLTDQLEQALESARLYQDTQLSAERERLIGEITARIRERLDMESVVKTAAQEIRQALGVPELTVRLAARDSNGDTSGSE